MSFAETVEVGAQNFLRISCKNSSDASFAEPREIDQLAWNWRERERPLDETSGGHFAGQKFHWIIGLSCTTVTAEQNGAKINGVIVAGAGVL